MGQYVICNECGIYFKPFYFGDRPFNRGVMQDCPKCGNLVGFEPESLKSMSDEQEAKLRDEGAWLKTDAEQHSEDRHKELKEEYETKYKHLTKEDIKNKLKGYERINAMMSKLLFETLEPCNKGV